MSAVPQDLQVDQVRGNRERDELFSRKAVACTHGCLQGPANACRADASAAAQVPSTALSLLHSWPQLSGLSSDIPLGLGAARRASPATASGAWSALQPVHCPWSALPRARTAARPRETSPQCSCTRQAWGCCRGALVTTAIATTPSERGHAGDSERPPGRTCASVSNASCQGAAGWGLPPVASLSAPDEDESKLKRPEEVAWAPSSEHQLEKDKSRRMPTTESSASHSSIAAALNQSSHNTRPALLAV